MKKQRVGKKEPRYWRLDGEILAPSWLILIFILALSYRILCHQVFGAHPLLTHPVVDAGYHLAWANRILAGDWLGHGPDDVFKPPLYAYFTAACFHLFGRAVAAVQWVQYLLGSLTVVMASVLASRLLGPRVGLAAGLLSAWYAPYVFFESQLLTPALGLFLNLAAWLVLVRPNRLLTPGRMTAAGALIGLSAGVRPDVLMPFGLVVAYLLWRERTFPWFRLVRLGIWMVVGLTSVILPITIRNAALTGEFIPISSNGGINFYTGNSAQADGLSAVPVGLRWERLVAQVPQEILEKPARAGRWWTHRTWSEILAFPGRALRRLPVKGLAFFNAREFRNNIGYDFFREQAWPLAWPFLQFSLIMPLAILGWVCLAKSPRERHSPALALTTLWTAGFWLAGLAFFVTARYRLPVLPLLMVPAAYGLMGLLDAVASKNPASLGRRLAVVTVGGLILVWPTWITTGPESRALDLINLGNALQADGRGNEAREAYGRALDFSDDPDAHYLLARLLLNQGRAGEALDHLIAARRSLPEAPDLLFVSAQALLAQDLGKPAADLLNQILKTAGTSNLWPRRNIWALTHLLLADLEPDRADDHRAQAWLIDPNTVAENLFLQNKEMEKVLAVFRNQAAERYWDWYAQANYGLALLRSGQADQAAEQLRQAGRLAPEQEGLQLQLARALAAAGRNREARQVLDELLPDLPDGPFRRDVLALRDSLT